MCIPQPDVDVSAPSQRGDTSHELIEPHLEVRAALFVAVRAVGAGVAGQWLPQHVVSVLMVWPVCELRVACEDATPLIEAFKALPDLPHSAQWGELPAQPR